MTFFTGVRIPASLQVLEFAVTRDGRSLQCAPAELQLEEALALAAVAGSRNPLPFDELHLEGSEQNVTPGHLKKTQRPCFVFLSCFFPYACLCLFI